MLRITVGGPGLAGFPNGQDGAYLKLRLPADITGSSEPQVRTYTIRYYRSVAAEIDIDFVLHDAAGPAAGWARSCEPGDKVTFGGPGPKKIAAHDADWFLFAGDMSALPAIGANLEALPRDATGYALLEIIDDGDRQSLDAPRGLEIEWLVNRHPDEENTVLFDKVRTIDWLDGTPYVWVAGEFSQSLAIRRWLKQDKGLGRETMYASSYWQIGQTEDGHRISKRSAAAD